MKTKEESTHTRIKASDQDRLKAIAKAFNLPMTKAITKVIDVFEESGKRRDDGR